MNDTYNSPLPQDPQDRTLARLMGLPNGAHTQPSVAQAIDYYGNKTNYTVQTVRWDEGNTVFIDEMSASGHKRYMLPPKVLALIERQAAAVSNMVRRRHGKRLAEQRKAEGFTPQFTPEMRAKALVTRRAKAAKRKARRARKSS
jgi:hypothetical protein